LKRTPERRALTRSRRSRYGWLREASERGHRVTLVIVHLHVRIRPQPHIGPCR
jgi:hypothetical protein